MNYHSQTYAKWILSGEHAVLRGHPALVFPLANFSLELTYRPSAKALTFIGDRHFKDLFMQIWHMTGNPMTGQIELTSNIPIGTGLGASAALSLAVARISKQIKPEASSEYELAKQLEHLFHGQSSGLDIIGSGSQTGQHFQQGISHPIEMNWQPIWALSHSGDIGQTKKAVQKVQDLICQHPLLAAEIDQQMSDSVLMIEQALSEPLALDKLAQGMTLAQECFRAWGLINQNMQNKMDELLRLGAKAVKPSGSGGGGYILSVWDSVCLDSSSLVINLPNDKRSHPV